MLDYNALLLSFIINVPSGILTKIKPYLIEVVAKLERDDHSYVYAPDHDQVAFKRGQALASLSNFANMQQFRLDVALKHTMSVLQQEDSDIHTYIFIILDQYDPSKEAYGIVKALNTDLKRDLGYHFVWCDIGNASQLAELCALHPRCHYLQIKDITQMAQQLSDIFYPSIATQITDVRQKLEDQFQETQKKSEYHDQDIPDQTTTQEPSGTP